MVIRKQIVSLLQILTGKDEPIAGVARRFIFAFQEHGVEPAQIPRILPKIRLGDLHSPQSLLATLTPEVLDNASRLLGIRTEWLEGVDDRIYEYLAYYKEPIQILQLLSEVIRKDGAPNGFPLRILTSECPLDREQGTGGYQVPVILERIQTLGDEDIYRYHIFQDGIDWHHKPCRIELKAVAQIVFSRLRAPIPLFRVSDQDIQEVLEGRLIPRSLLDRCTITNPSLEDYVLGEKSHVARETDELPEVLSYLHQTGLDNFSFERTEPLSLVPVLEPDATVDDESEANSPINAREDKNHHAPSPTSSGSSWQDKAREIADELHLIDVQCGAHDSLRNIADRVAHKMRERKMYGPRGPLSGPTILRDALQGGRWKSKV